jgi:hypothetical protein
VYLITEVSSIIELPLSVFLNDEILINATSPLHAYEITLKCQLFLK